MFGRKPQSVPQTHFQMLNDDSESFYDWNGYLYKSDIVRACIRPKAKAIGKLMAKHLKESSDDFQENPDRNIRFLLEEPNPLMTGQVLQEKVAVQLDLNNNAFILIKRDADFKPEALYPIPCISVEVVEGSLGDLYLKFSFRNGKQMTVPYVDVIHLRQDFNENDFFGDSPADALTSLMEVVSTIDQGVMKAIKNSAVIKWIMQFTQVLKPNDQQEQIDNFTKNFLDIEKSGGAVPADPRYQLHQVKQDSFVPDDKQMTNTTKRIYDFFNTNEAIVQSKYTEDEWNAYYEAVIEPVAMQLSGEYSRKLLSRNKRERGHKIVFSAMNLQYASMATKLNLMQMVDRGAMTPNEWRKVLNMPPVEGGDKPVRRLDTQEVRSYEGGEEDGRNGNQGIANGQSGNP